MKKCLQDVDVYQKKVLVRCDFNVPIKDSKILDNSKILASLETIQYLIDKECKIILMSHLGKIKTEEDKKKNSLEIVAKELKKLLQVKVIFAKTDDGLKEFIDTLNYTDVVLLENTRFYDYPDNLESGNDTKLAEFFASLADIFVMDAFGTSHRQHASTYGVSKYLPSCVGFLIQREIEMLDTYVLNPDKPFTIIMGGAKIDDKLELMEKLLPKCDHLIVAGALANTCLKVLGFSIGQSVTTDNSEVLNKVKNMLQNYKDKIVLPYDVLVGNNFDDNYILQKDIDSILDNDIIYDIGTKTIEAYKSVILESMSVFVNGTVGKYEDMKYANGTREIFNILANSGADVVVGGGDSASAARNLGYADKLTYISTGGGATLEYLVSEKLLALDNIEDIK